MLATNYHPNKIEKGILNDNKYYIYVVSDTCLTPETLIVIEEEDKKGKKRRKRKMLKDIKMECFQVIDIVKKLIYNISN